MKKQLFILLTFVCIQSGYLISMEKKEPQASTSRIPEIKQLVTNTANETGVPREKLLAIITAKALQTKSVTPKPEES